MQYEYKHISEIQVGDIVVTHGMRCLVDRPVEISKSHGIAADGSHCRYTQALVLNRDEVNVHMVPWSFTADWDRNGKYMERPHHGQHRWSIQSNDLIRWAVEAEAHPDDVNEGRDLIVIDGSDPGWRDDASGD